MVYIKDLSFKFYDVQPYDNGEKAKARFDCPLCGHHMTLGVYPIGWWTAIGCLGCKKMIPHPAHVHSKAGYCHCPEISLAEFMEKYVDHEKDCRE